MPHVERLETFVVDHGSSLRWTEQAGVCHLTTTIVRLTDSDGVEGLAGYDSYTPRPTDLSVLEALCSLSPALIGRDVDDRDGLSDDLRAGVVFPFSLAPLSLMDIALWDIAARRAQVPLWKVLGGERDRIAAYASLTTLAGEQDYLDTVAAACATGLRAVKVHAWGEPARDLALLERLHDEHPGLALMHDAEGVYDRDGALRVGRGLDELGARWYEAPLPDFDLDGYRELRRALEVPLLPAGYSMYDAQQVAEALKDPPWTAVRAEATCTFGVTGLVKLGRVAEAFGLDYEPVSYGHTLCQAANLHVMLASPRTSYFELPFPVEPWEYGVVEPLRPDAEGMVAAPRRPGLGVVLDWEWVRAHAAARVALPE